MSRFIGVVCGLQSEAKVVRLSCNEPQVRIGVSGANASRAEKIAADFCAEGAGVIISVGVSGGLDPAMTSGRLLIGDAVTTMGGDCFQCDQVLLRAILREGRSPVHLYGSDDIIASAAEKAAIFKKCEAVAVDMESHGAARAAKTSEVPFLAIRAVADPADRALPSAAMNAVAPDGSTRVLKTLLECAKAPGQFPALLKLGSDSEKALKTLRGELPAIFKAIKEAL